MRRQAQTIRLKIYLILVVVKSYYLNYISLFLSMFLQTNVKTESKAQLEERKIQFLCSLRWEILI